MLTHASRLHLLQGLVDYAGLFPPAALPLDQTVARYLEYQQSSAAFLLGRLICPAGRLHELAIGGAARISALVNEPGELAHIEAFHARMPRQVRVDCIETRFTTAGDAQEMIQRWQYLLYFEVGPSELAEAAAVCGPAPRVGLKFRTGALVPEGIPAAQQLVDFLQAVRAAGLPFKFTAGLHHALSGVYPLTYAQDSPKARMYGFASLFGLACLHWWDRLSPAELLRGLSQDSTTLTLDETGLHYGSAVCTPAEIEEFRTRGGRSFGSCSFEEPVTELREMTWI